jgi:hypothetical protein
MMQKMMAQTSPNEGKPPMEKMMGMCMGMCAEMLSAIRTTSALAASATPELQNAFTEWLKGTEDAAVKLIANGATDTAALLAHSSLVKQAHVTFSTAWRKAAKLLWLPKLKRPNGD